MRHKYYYEMPIGNMCIEEEDGEIIRISILKDISTIKQSDETDVLKKAHEQLLEYFQGKRIEFDLPIKLVGSDFQLKVWNALTTIPYGETRNYKEIAKQIGNDKAVRAVGGANSKNPIMIVVPCHRVIGESGKLVGFSAGVEVKKYLLNLENTNSI